MIHNQLYKVMQQNLHHPAIWVNDVTYTYAELLAHCTGVARILQQLAFNNDRCALYTKRSIHAYATILACYLTGNTYLPLSPNLPLLRNLKMLEIGKAKALIIDVDEAEATTLLNHLKPTHVIVFDQRLYLYLCTHITQHHYHFCYFEQDAFLDFPTKINEHDYAYLLFTSGSTGQPKGIGITYANLRTYIQNCQQLYTFSEKDKFSQIAELTFDLSVHDIFLCWAAAATLYVLPEKNIFALAHFIKTHHITVMTAVPSTVSLLAQFGHLTPHNFLSLKFTFFCGEPLFTQQAKQWTQAAPQAKIINMYGPTEATVSFTHFIYSSQYADLHVVPIGYALSQQQSAVITPKGELAGPGEVGELCLAGTQVITRYWHSSKSIRKVFKKFSWDSQQYKWYLTGDLVRWDKACGYYFCGRVDDQWQIRGYRVEKLEIEIAIQSIIDSTQVAVIPIISEQGCVIGMDAYVVSDLTVPLILQRLRLQLPEVMIPKHIHHVAVIPKNISGKIDYCFLRETTGHDRNLCETK